MIDSITLGTEHFIVYDELKFTKAKHQELRGKFGIFGRHSVRYTTYVKQCKAEGRYFPQVSIVERSSMKKRNGQRTKAERRLMIQVSLPKLIFATNLFDIDERCIELCATRLADMMREIGIGISTENILHAHVFRADFSKILKIAPKYAKTQRILKELEAYDNKARSAYNRITYHDDNVQGKYLKYYNGTRGLVIYDKFDEIIINGSTNLEHAIAEQYKRGKWKYGAIRFELSIHKKQSLDAIMRRHTKTKKRYFQFIEVASESIAKAILLEEFRTLYVDGFQGMVRLKGLKEAELLNLLDNETNSYREKGFFYYLVHRIQNIGLSDALEEMRGQCAPSTFGRYKKDAERLMTKLEARHDEVSLIGYLEKRLQDFRPIMPKKFKELL